MGGIMRQDEIGRCDFIDVLEEAVLTRQPVTVKMRDGQCFTDVIRDVKTEGGHDYVVFNSHETVRIDRIHGCSRAEPQPVVH
jgi:Rho-binding antiterminator